MKSLRDCDECAMGPPSRDIVTQPQSTFASCYTTTDSEERTPFGLRLLLRGDRDVRRALLAWIPGLEFLPIFFLRLAAQPLIPEASRSFSGRAAFDRTQL